MTFVSILSNLSEGGTDKSYVVVEQTSEGGMVRRVSCSTKEEAETIRAEWQKESLEKE